MERVKFLDKKTLKEIIDEDNQLTEWGGKDDYTFKFEPEVRGKKKMANGTVPTKIASSKKSKV